MVVAWLVPHEMLPFRRKFCVHHSTRSQCHFIQSDIGRVYACLAVNYHLHFWQNDRDLLRATAVTRGWNGYRNKSQHRKLSLEKKILPLFLQDSNPRPFNHESDALTTEPLSRSPTRYNTDTQARYNTDIQARYITYSRGKIQHGYTGKIHYA